MIIDSDRPDRQATAEPHDAAVPEAPPNHQAGPAARHGEFSITAEAIALGALGAGTYLVAQHYDIFEQLYEFSVANEAWEVDEIFTVSLVLLAGFIIFAMRRVSGQKGEIVRRKAVERELVRYQGDLERRVEEATAALRAQAHETEQALATQKEYNELQRKFLALTSHELRTPLSIIDGTAQRLKRKAADGDLSPAESLKRVDKIRKAVARMVRLIERTLTAARLDEGKLEIKTAPCDVAAVVKEVCAQQQEITPDHVIRHDMDALPETIAADAGAIEQIFSNLLSNAVKYSPGTPDITVTGRVEGDHVVISVRDRGLGIDAEDLPRMFERFFRAGTASGIGGTGIGLSVVKSLAEMHGGSASAESETGVGSTFTVRLPIAGPSQSQQPAAQVA